MEGLARKNRRNSLGRDKTHGPTNARELSGPDNQRPNSRRAEAGSAAASCYALSSSYFPFSFFLFLFSFMVSVGFFLFSLLPLSFFPLSPMSASLELEMPHSNVLFLSVIHHAWYLLKSIMYYLVPCKMPIFIRWWIRPLSYPARIGP